MNTFEKTFDAEKQVMLDFINAHPEVTLADIMNAVGGPTTRRRQFLYALRKKGQLRLIGKRDNISTYTGLTTRKTLARASEKRATPQGGIWMAMRTLGKFSHADVVAALAATDQPVLESDVRCYCTGLLAAGYLRVLRKADRARGWEARYLLRRDTGPLPPEIKRKQVVIDPNEDRVVHVQGARI